LRRVILAICATAVALVLLLSFKTHTQTGLGSSPAAALGTPTPGDGATAAGTSASPAASASPANSGTANSGTGASGAAKTVTGALWPTIYGPVQVQITVKSGKITAVNAPEYPEGTPRDQQINSYAIPQLNHETLAADSAHIDTVSGATYTSGGYIGSLQNALDKAGMS
jgi:uncharacterized protein with FMN-binding domain